MRAPESMAELMGGYRDDVSMYEVMTDLDPLNDKEFEMIVAQTVERMREARHFWQMQDRQDPLRRTAYPRRQYLILRITLDPRT